MAREKRERPGRYDREATAEVKGTEGGAEVVPLFEGDPEVQGAIAAEEDGDSDGDSEPGDLSWEPLTDGAERHDLTPTETETVQGDLTDKQRAALEDLRGSYGDGDTDATALQELHKAGGGGGRGSGGLREAARRHEERKAAAAADASEAAALSAGLRSAVDAELPPEPGEELSATTAAGTVVGPAINVLDSYGEAAGKLSIKLPRQLTPAERSVRFGQLVEAEHRLKLAESAAKASAFEHRDRIKGCQAEIAGLLASEITEPTACEIRVDYRGNVRRVVRLDTLELVEERAMNEEERQLSLSGFGATKPPEHVEDPAIGQFLDDLVKPDADDAGEDPNGGASEGEE